MSRVVATTGKSKRWRLLTFFKSWDFTLGSIFLLTVLTTLLLGALFDISWSAYKKEQRVQESELKGQLAQFLLNIREADGSSLLENPSDFSAASRPITVVSLRRSFFSYMLQRANARAFKTGDINIEIPRACQLVYQDNSKSTELPGSLRACFAAVPGDPTGKYVYFFLRYPTSKIERHRVGKPLAEVNRVILTFSGQRESRISLAYQVPPLARMRYPSQLARFEQVHELSGFAAGEGGLSSRYLSGQAFESLVEENGTSPQNYVTIVGRLDSALLQAAGSDEAWPSDALKRTFVGIKVYDKSEPDIESKIIFDIPLGKEGTPLISLTQAYLSAVSSGTSLEITSSNLAGVRNTVWRSDDVAISPPTTRLDGWWQNVADGWSEFIISHGIRQRGPVSVAEDIRVRGFSKVQASLTATPFKLPDLATRAFTWMSAAGLVIVALAFYWIHNAIKLRQLRKMAYSMTVVPTRDGDLKKFTGRNEIGTLARVFYLLLKRSRSRDVSLVKRQRRIAIEQAEQMRLAEAHVVNRKSILDAIGHEIRAPLNSLFNATKGQELVQQKLSRIRRAVEALQDATSVEDGLRSGEIAMAPTDLAAWLQVFSNNLTQDGKGVKYVGPTEEVIVEMDSIQLEQILDNILDNAQRYRKLGTEIELRLSVINDKVELAVFNYGKPVPEPYLPRIFDLGVSGADKIGNSGLGLFASRIYALAMNLTLSARNEAGGVALVLQFPRTIAK